MHTYIYIYTCIHTYIHAADTISGGWGVGSAHKLDRDFFAVVVCAILEEIQKKGYICVHMCVTSVPYKTKIIHMCTDVRVRVRMLFTDVHVRVRMLFTDVHVRVRMLFTDVHVRVRMLFTDVHVRIHMLLTVRGRRMHKHVHIYIYAHSCTKHAHTCIHKHIHIYICTYA